MIAINTNFTDKELQVIQLMNPGVSPEVTCDAILRNWFNVTVTRWQAQNQTTDEIVDKVLGVAASATIDTTQTPNSNPII